MRELGIFAWFGYELPLRESFRLIRAAGFDRVMLWWGEYEGDIPLKDQPDRARRMGLEIENAHAPFDGCNTLWLPGEDGDRYVDSLIACLEGCAETGVPVLVAHLTDEASPPPYHSRGLDRLRRARRRPSGPALRLRWKTCVMFPICVLPCRHLPPPRSAFATTADTTTAGAGRNRISICTAAVLRLCTFMTTIKAGTPTGCRSTAPPTGRLPPVKLRQPVFLVRFRWRCRLTGIMRSE